MRRLVLLLLATVTVSAQPTRVAGSRASIDPPPGFGVADAFAGFQHEGLSASIMVTEVPGAPIGEMVDGMTDDAFVRQGVMVGDRRTVVVQGAEALLISGTQRAYGTTFAKWLLVTGDADAVFLVTAMIPDDLAAKHAPSLEDAVLSLTWGGEPPTDLFEGMGLRLDLSDALPERSRFGATLMLASDPPPSDGPFYLVGLGAAPLGPNLNDVARRRIRETVGVANVTDVRGQLVTVDGVAGWEAVAEGVDADSRAPVVVYLALVPTEAGYVIAQATAPADGADVWLDRFRALTASVRWDEKR